jgi:hypothetical protein
MDSLISHKSPASRAINKAAAGNPSPEADVMRSKLIIAANAVAILLFAAGAPPSASAAPADDACALLTQAQVSAALGVSVGAGERVVSTSSRMCGWSPPGEAVATSKRAVLTISSVESFTRGKAEVKGITKTPASGIGDDAYYITTPGFGTGLNVKKGTSAFQIRVYSFPLEQTKAMEKTLALQAVAKL